jgi:hypothetical protein
MPTAKIAAATTDLDAKLTIRANYCYVVTAVSSGAGEANMRNSSGTLCARKVGRMPLPSQFHQKNAQARRPFRDLLEGVHMSLSYPKAVTMLVAPEHSKVC